jgi:DNA polymerase I
MLMRVSYVDYLPEYEPDDYSPRDLVVRVVGRSEGGERVVRLLEGARPHCYVPEDETPADGGEGDYEVLNEETGYQGIDIDAGEKVPAKRVTLAHPKQTNDYVDQYSQSFEADIPFYRRVTWDHNLSGYIDVPENVQRVPIDSVETDIDREDVDPIDPRVAIGDIEVADEQNRGFDEMKREADAPVVAATWYDTYEEDYLVVVLDPEGEVEGSDVKQHIGEHWGDHEDAEQYVDDADITLSQVDTEADLLQRCIDYLGSREFDLTAGWNWVDFDWYYLLKRIDAIDSLNPHDLSDIGKVEMRKVNPDRRGVESAVEGLPAFDQMQGLDKQTYGEWRSRKLEFVANDQLGIGKIPGMTVATAYKNRRSEMTAYNLLDVQLTVALTEMHGIEDFWLDMADLCGIQVQDTFSEKRMVQGYIGTRRSDDRVMPTNENRDIETPAGGLVLTPGDGIYENVAVLDLKSLYPSSMVTMNISPETMTDPSDADVVIPGMPEKEANVEGSITEENINWTDNDPSLPWSQRPKGFDLDELGIIPEFAREMFPERERYKDLRDEYDPEATEYVVYDNAQGGVKVVHNSMFGVENSQYFPLAKNGIGDAITGISRYILWRAAEYIESQGYEVIYGDTDSVLVRLDYDDRGRGQEELLLEGQGLQSQLNDHMATVADDIGLPDDHPFVDASEMPHDLPDSANHLWFFEFEKLYDNFIQVGSKKRYAGTLSWKEGKDVDELDVTGFEAERSDQMEITSEVQRQVIRAILDDWDFAEVSELVREEIERFSREADDLHEIGVPWNLNKPLSGPDSYGNLPNARAARFSNEHLDKDYSPGDDFRGYYVSRTPSFVPETDVIALDWTDDIPEGYKLNRDKTIEKAFESALTPLLEEVGWTFNEIREGKQNQPATDDSVTEYHGDPWSSEGSEDDGDDDTDTESTGGAGESEPHGGSDQTDDDEPQEEATFGGAGAW